jgi:2-polyprenyl-3-methyl-5-hydroxy-6-metoxy-1,4-benzoquinol methylase
METIIHYTSCPACKSTSIKEALTAKDYTVSNKIFAVWECGNCSFRFTQDVPNATAIAPYYQSDAYVSHSDTQEGLVNRLYHIVRRYTLKGKCILIQQYTGLQRGNLLDIGAGTGAFAHAMQLAGWEITALEPDENARKISLNKYQLQLQSSENIYEMPSNQFDAITMWHVLEHVHDLHGYLEKFSTILKPNGTVFIAVPNYTCYDAKSYQQYWAAYDVPRHLYHFSPKSMELLAAAKGFTVKAFKPMWFDSFYVAMLSEQYKNGKNNLFKAFFTGVITTLQSLMNVKKSSSIIYVLQKA